MTISSLSFNQRVYEIVSLIPCGSVMNYGGVAHLAGSSRASRAVGYALHTCPDSIPWHRVVYKDGSLPFSKQYSLLKAEKISFTKEGKVNMAKHLLDTTDLEAAISLGFL